VSDTHEMSTDERALHAGVEAHPHSSHHRLVLADYYDDNNMPEHALAHRWLAHSAETKQGVPPPVTHEEWQEQTKGLDTSVLSGVLSHEAHKGTGRAVRASGPLLARHTDIDGINRRGRTLSGLTISSELANHFANPDNDAPNHYRANSHHASVVSPFHENLANFHEAYSYTHQPPTPDEVKHGEAGALHRLGQDYHHLAGQAHGWTDLDSWQNSRKV
jgi:hypothetical protein